MAEPYDLLVTGGTLVSSGGRQKADLATRGGRIAAIAEPGTLGAAAEVLDASGLYVLPGVIDAHVHFRSPGLEHEEDWESGTRAAVFGGVTTVLDMPNTIPPTATVDAARLKVALAQRAALCDFGLFGLLGAGDVAIADLAGSGLVVALKAFLGPTTGEIPSPTDEELSTGLRAARRAGLRVAFHAEDAELVARATEALRAAGRIDPLAHLEARPAAAEVAAIDRVGPLLIETRAAGHIAHLTSIEGLAAVGRWKELGADLTCEVTPHHALLLRDVYSEFLGLAKVNPPIRGEPHASALIKALAEGRIDTVASDHAPHLPAAKAHDSIWDVAAGIPGVETLLRLLLTEVAGGRLTLEAVVRATSERPARAFGLWPRKGALAVGADADMVLVDAQVPSFISAADLHGKNKFTPFEGRATIGQPVATVVRGRIVMRDGDLLAQPGWGSQVAAARNATER